MTEITIRPRPNIGDRVRILHGAYEGKAGTVTNLTEIARRAVVRIDGFKVKRIVKLRSLGVE